MTVHRSCLLVALFATLLLVGPPSARAAGGRYTVEGGTAAERAQIGDALRASSFDWSLVPAQIEIHVARGVDSRATPGQIWLDADLLDSGRFAWGVVQHEYAHEVDFFLLTDAVRAELLPRLGGEAWSNLSGTDSPHRQLAAERFASTLAWSYWPSPDNVMRPDGQSDESAAMAPAPFRALLERILPRDRSLASVRRLRMRGSTTTL
jgi:hypothetical protein